MDSRRENSFGAARHGLDDVGLFRQFRSSYEKGWAHDCGSRQFAGTRAEAIGGKMRGGDLIRLLRRKCSQPFDRQ